MRIVTLVDNRPGNNKELSCEHGLSFWIEHQGTQIIFDGGASRSAAENAFHLGIDLSTADYVMCSHNHWDHGIGIAELIRSGVVKRLIVGSGFMRKKQILLDNGELQNADSGITKEDIRKNEIELQESNGCLEFSSGCFAVSGFPRVTPFEKIQSHFVVCSEKDTNDYEKDTFEDEQCLVLDEGDRVVMIVGCSHPGIINMVQSVLERFQKPIHAVIGGTHLMEASEGRIYKTLARLKQMRVEQIGFCHCSGERAVQIIKEDPDMQGFYLATGEELLF